MLPSVGLNWLSNFNTSMSRVAPSRWLALMLLTLHVAVVFGADAMIMRAFLLAHYGLFLLWQPLVRSESRIEPSLALPVFAMAALLVLVDSPWVMALWLAILTGLVGAARRSAMGGALWTSDTPIDYFVPAFDPTSRRCFRARFHLRRNAVTPYHRGGIGHFCGDGHR